MNMDYIPWFKWPMPAIECQGYALAYLLSVLRLGVVVQYWRITGIWLKWMDREPLGVSIPWCLAWIFRFCAIGGYALFIPALWFPVFYFFAIPAMICEIIASEIFMRITRGVRFMASGGVIKDGLEIQEVSRKTNMSMADIRKTIEELKS